jgi:hypothetical protein
MFNTEIGVNTYEYGSILESGLLAAFPIRDKLQGWGTGETFNYIAKLPLYPWHLPHLSSPLTTRIEF